MWNGGTKNRKAAKPDAPIATSSPAAITKIIMNDSEQVTNTLWSYSRERRLKGNSSHRNGTEIGISSQLYLEAASWTFSETASGLSRAFSINGRIPSGGSSATSDTHTV